MKCRLELCGGERPVKSNPVSQAAEGELHDDTRETVLDEAIVYGDDIGVIEFRRDAGLTEHPLSDTLPDARLGIEHLDGPLYIQLKVMNAVDDRRASSPDRVEGLVSAAGEFREGAHRDLSWLTPVAVRKPYTAERPIEALLPGEMDGHQLYPFRKLSGSFANSPEFRQFLLPPHLGNNGQSALQK